MQPPPSSSSSSAQRQRRQPAWICPESARIEGYPGDCKLLCLCGVHSVVVVCDDYGREGGERETPRRRGEPREAAAVAAAAGALALAELPPEWRSLRIALDLYPGNSCPIRFPVSKAPQFRQCFLHYFNIIYVMQEK